MKNYSRRMLNLIHYLSEFKYKHLRICLNPNYALEFYYSFQILQTQAFA